MTASRRSRRSSRHAASRSYRADLVAEAREGRDQADVDVAGGGGAGGHKVSVARARAGLTTDRERGKEPSSGVAGGAVPAWLGHTTYLSAASGRLCQATASARVVRPSA
jgi:hypothetical protein